MRDRRRSAASKKTFFAITSLGKDRWYWVVWPSLEALQAGLTVPHLADGHTRTKLEAVDQALEVAGMDGEWVAAKYAKQHHRALSRARRATAQGRDGAAGGPPAAQEFLYRDAEDEATGELRSVPHRVQRKTERYTFVEQQPYDASRVTGSWADHGAPTFRLDRTMLEQEGYAFVPLDIDTDDPLFFATPYRERVVHRAEVSPACLAVLGLSFPCTVAQVRAAYREMVKQAHPDQGGSHEQFIALRSAYEEALRLCRGGPRRGGEDQVPH